MLVVLTVVAICALASVVFFFSVLLSVFRSKHEGYPYRYTLSLKIILLLISVAQQFQVLATTQEVFCATFCILYVVIFRYGYKC